ncbi:MAG TPA: HU family DNA-binding protein [Candidatus Scatomorpha intestinavium]|uniref:HU family DNA-binding protein n=1 Tax=Candidatus Scatomorpha intestinavium TaxID=2840922 RepID=A0A9D0ZES0_9FIRM|nr:HU family DNA-binding protein [Candidatus Scatomorpha intestinavium]
MNKAELITAAAEKAGITRKDAEKAISAALEVITEELVAGERVSIVGFGSFDVKTRGERVGRNPRTREEITIAASRVPQFKAGKALKDAVAK